ncbi:MAG: SGNH/GDSL hydrolase family protein [Bacteroidia bacterium]|nr:SGNH/GDSL hydrolase family protein [Bacteroidia bacterium]
MNDLISRFSLTLLLVVCLFGCDTSPEQPQNPGPSIKIKPPTSYLALGDSYTIGESVDENERWPVILQNALNEDTNLNVIAPKIIARTGWTTNELKDGIKKEMPESDYALVSLLIGVNNQFRGYDFEQYEKEFVELIDTAILKAGGRGDKVFVVSIPDYGVTPFGQSRNVEKVAKEIDEYNAYAKLICSQRGIPFFDITPISRKGLDDPDLIAKDGLHPSGKMYAQWVDLMKDRVKEIVELE